MRTSLKISVAAAVGALALSAPAQAAPARTGQLGAGQLTYTWQSVGTGVLGLQDAMDAVGCVPFVHDCDDTLLEVKLPGQLTVTTSSSDPLTPDTDLQVFTSDADGNPQEELHESAATTPTPNESATVEVEPGFYIARVDYAIAANGTVDGEAVLAPAVPPATATIRKPKSRNVKSFAGATEGGDAALVEVGLLQRAKGGKCRQLTATSGRFSRAPDCDAPSAFLKARGTGKWSLKLKRKLKKGRYVLFARATDAEGRTQAEPTKRSFTVRK